MSWPAGVWTKHKALNHPQLARRAHEITTTTETILTIRPTTRRCACRAVCVPDFSKMPVGVHPPRRENPHVPPSSSHRDAAEEERLVQLQRATQQNDPPGDDGGDGGDAVAEPMVVTDGARNPVAAGADYTSLRAITRRAPRDPEYLVEGIDTSNVDLSWNALDSLTDPQGRPWKYPKSRTRAEGSNLEQFRDEIETRTKEGQGCKAIAEILIEKGVDTSSRAVARMRMKWGLRQRVGAFDVFFVIFHFIAQAPRWLADRGSQHLPHRHPGG